MEQERVYNDERFLNYKDLKNKLEKTLDKVRKTSDLYRAKAYLIEIQDSFKGLKLYREDREELYNKLQLAFAELNQKINEEHLNFQNEATANYFLIKSKVDEAVSIVHNSKNTKEAWNFLIQVQSLFKGAKLLREHRETLYTRLQEAFNVLKEIQAAEKLNVISKSEQEYNQLKQSVDEAIAFAMQCEDSRVAKDKLINIQTVLREAELIYEHKNELYTKLQEAFGIIRIRIEEGTQNLNIQAQIQYEDFNLKVKELLSRAEHSSDFKTLREQLKDLQLQIRESNILREHRVEMQEILQRVFEKLNSRQDTDRNTFLKEASENYNRLKALVNKGLIQAKETHEYKDTREFLKKIQSEFKGIKMIKEEREELYSHLQLAFEILNTRVDEYFRTKKKNWEVKMRYKLSEINTEMHQLKNEVEKERENLVELEEHLDILNLSGKDGTTKIGIEARIISARNAIEQKMLEIEKLEMQMVELQNRIEPEE